MGRTLHAFTSYKVEEIDYSLEINYENDKDRDIAYGNWHYVYTVIQYGTFLLGTDIHLPIYHWLDDADLVKEKGMKLVKPQEFVKICEAVIENIIKLPDTENPLIDEHDCQLYESDRDDSFERQKEKILEYAKMLLTLAKQGLYFVSERD